MAHWRDGGIGNMAGSDDRPFREWTLLEKLADLAGGSGNMPDRTAQEAFDEIQRLREAHRDAMTPDQIAAYRRLLDDSISARAEKDPEQHIFLRGWNAAIQHAGKMLDKTLKSALAPETVADTAAAPGLTDPPVAAAVSGAESRAETFERVSALAGLSPKGSILPPSTEGGINRDPKVWWRTAP